MKNKVFGAERVVECELLDAMPSALNHVIQDVTNRLVDRVVCELEKGESICSLQTVEQNQFSDLNSVEIRRTVTIKPLVRCGECRYGITAHGISDGWVLCSKPYTERGNAMHRDDWFCADGERKK